MYGWVISSRTLLSVWFIIQAWIKVKPCEFVIEYSAALFWYSIHHFVCHVSSAATTVNISIINLSFWIQCKNCVTHLSITKCQCRDRPAVMSQQMKQFYWYGFGENIISTMGFPVMLASMSKLEWYVYLVSVVQGVLHISCLRIQHCPRQDCQFNYKRPQTQ